MYEKNKKTFQKILFFIADSSFYLQRTFKLKAQKGGKKLANENLHKAKEAKNDEFYTQLNDVSEELRHYKEHFKDKIIFCNCDDPTWSAFWRYFHLNFEHLGLKKLISTHYDREKPTYKMEYTGGNDNDIEAGVKTPLEGNGDFRNQECIDLLKEADIVVTNPPFSIAREDFIPQLFEYKKKFLIIGDLNWVTYKIIFPLLKNNEMWMGYSAVKEFLQPDGTIKKFGNKLWFTNLDIKKRHEKLILWKNYTSAEFPRYDNYDAINVDKVSNIPCDYCESWEVTEDEFKNFSADEWEITRTGELDGEKSFFIIPAADTELRKLLHEHATGYKEEIEKEIIKRIQKNINNDRLPSGRQAAERQKDTVTESLECQSPSLTSTIQHSLKSLEQQSQKERDSVTVCGLQNQELHSLLSTSSENISACLQERYCNGVAGVPITFLDKYSPDQFEIVNANDYRKTENVPVKSHGLIKDKDASITLSESKKEMQKSIDKKDSKNIIAKSRAEQSRAEQSRAEQSGAEQSRAEQSRAEQSRAEQSRAEADCLCTNLYQEETLNCSHLEVTDGISPENENMQGFLSDRYCNGVFGVPITYLDKYNPEQFEIIGMLQSSTDEQAGIPNLRFYNSFREMRQDMSYTGASGGKANGNPVIKEKPKKGNFLYNEKTGEYVHSVYARIVIRRKL